MTLVLLAALAAILLVLLPSMSSSGATSYGATAKTKYSVGSQRAGQATLMVTGVSTARHMRGAKNISAFIQVPAPEAGGTQTLDFKVQHSADGVVWHDEGTTFTQVTTVAFTQTKRLTGDVLPWLRLYPTVGAGATYLNVRAGFFYDEDRTSLPASPLASQ